jgi:hypothetical protein
MGERIAWMMSSRSDTFAIDLKYTDIKSQKISPEGKAKIQLQVIAAAPATLFLWPMIRSLFLEIFCERIVI